MTAEEKEKFTKMEQSVEEIKSDVAQIKSALIGNEISGDRGIIGQVTLLKAEIDFLKKDLDIVQKEAVRNGVIINQLKYVAGTAVAGVIALIIKLIFS
jgi:hypothetical protein